MKKGEKELKKAKLKVWENPKIDRNYTVEISFPEFTSLCPATGYPDFAEVKINYIPDKYIIELKSLKLYLNSFRDEYISHEEATNKIYNELEKILAPKFLEVTGNFNIRGGIKTVVKVSSEENNKQNEKTN